MGTLYDHLGKSYGATRREEPRIAALIRAALGDARSVVNVGAGLGAYEPTDLDVVAVEPSDTMIAQRPPGSARVIQASAEELPFADGSFDAALAVNTLHHWGDVRAGLRELGRVAKKRIVIFLRDPRRGVPFWLTESYLPLLGPSARLRTALRAIENELPSLEARAMPLPRDCADGLFSAYWGRPELYLDAEIRRNISNFALAREADVAPGLASLERDLAVGAWDRSHAPLRSLPELDLGHCVLVAELAAG